MLQALERRREIRSILNGSKIANPQPVAAVPPPAAVPAGRARVRAGSPVVLIGVSTGGPTALAQVLPALTAQNRRSRLDSPAHASAFYRSPGSTIAGPQRHRCQGSARTGKLPLPDCAYLAPGGRQMKLPPVRTGRTRDPHYRRSAGERLPSFGRLPVSLRRASFPGPRDRRDSDWNGQRRHRGDAHVEARWSLTIAQDEASCVVFGMPREAILAGVVDTVVPLGKVADAIVRAVAESSSMIRLLRKNDRVSRSTFTRYAP